MPNFSVDRFESLRRAGKTYSEMEKILGVSRNTLKSYASNVLVSGSALQCVCAGSFELVV